MARVFVIGLDGVPEGMLRRLCAAGVMPRCAAAIEGGLLRRISSTYPPLSSVAWSTVLTGVGPGAHGVFGFVECDARTYEYTFPLLSDLKAPALWETLGRAGKRAAFINVPATYPAPPMNGVLVSGFVAPSLAGAVWPRALLPELEARGYAIDADARLGHADPGALLGDLARVLAHRRWLIRRVWRDGPWDFFMTVFTGTDRALHFLFDAAEDAAHPLGEGVRAYFGLVDEAAGEVLALVEDGDLLILLSDHGFGPLRREIRTNGVLAELGFLAFDAEAPEDLTTMTAESRAFALDPGRIYLHTRERFPRARARKSEGLLEEVAAGIARYCAERGIAGTVLRGREIYAGPCAGAAPDLLVMGGDGDDWKGRVGAAVAAGTGAFTGRHTYDNAFLCVCPPSALPPDAPADLTAVAHCVRRHYGIDP